MLMSGAVGAERVAQGARLDAKHWNHDRSRCEAYLRPDDGTGGSRSPHGGDNRRQGHPQEGQAQPVAEHVVDNRPAMPELPDVTVYVEALRKRIVGQPLTSLRLAS